MATGIDPLLVEPVDLARAAARRRSESPTSSAISCSACAPRSRRCAIRRASFDRRRVVARGVEDQRAEEQPLRVRRARRAPRPRRSSAVVSSLIRSTSEKRRIWAGSSRNGSLRRRLHGLGQLRERPLEHAGRLEEPPGAGVALAGARRRAAWWRRRSSAAVRRSTSRSSRAAAARDGRRPATWLRGLERDVEREARGGLFRRGRPTPSSTRSQPPSGRVAELSTRSRGPLRICVDAHAQQRRRHQRGRQHDEQQRRVEVAAEDRLRCSPMVAKISPTSPRGIMPMPMSHLSPGEPKTPTAATSLPIDRDHQQRRGDAEHLGVDELLDLGLDADLEEEHRDEQVPDRRELALDALLRRAAREREAGDERTDDRRELGGVGQLRERERERERDRHQGARRLGVTIQELEEPGRELRRPGPK